MKNITLVVAIIVCCAANVGAQDISGLDFYLQDINGEDQSFHQYLSGGGTSDRTSGKGIVVIAFWGLCKACQQEMKALRRVHDQNSHKNLRILAININNIRSVAKVKSYVTAHKLPYDVWLDPVNDVFKKFNGQAVPYTLIINSNGKVILKHHGFTAGDEKKFVRIITDELE